MIYALGLHLITDSQTVIDTFKVKIPAKLDSKIWETEYNVGEISEDGHKVLEVMVRFNEQADRTTSLNWLANKAAELEPQLLTGSYVTKHKCWHDNLDEAGEPIPNTPCVPIVVWSK